jgi:hypothetical protein
MNICLFCYCVTTSAVCCLRTIAVCLLLLAVRLAVLHTSAPHTQGLDSSPSSCRCTTVVGSPETWGLHASALHLLGMAGEEGEAVGVGHQVCQAVERVLLPHAAVYVHMVVICAGVLQHVAAAAPCCTVSTCPAVVIRPALKALFLNGCKEAVPVSRILPACVRAKPASKPAGCLVLVKKSCHSLASL